MAHDDTVKRSRDSSRSRGHLRLVGPDERAPQPAREEDAAYRAGKAFGTFCKLVAIGASLVR